MAQRGNTLKRKNKKKEETLLELSYSYHVPSCQCDTVATSLAVIVFGQLSMQAVLIALSL